MINLKKEYRNALEMVEDLPEEQKEYVYTRLFDQPTHDMIEQILELTKPEDWEFLVKEAFENQESE